MPLKYGFAHLILEKLFTERFSRQNWE